MHTRPPRVVAALLRKSPRTLAARFALELETLANAVDVVAADASFKAWLDGVAGRLKYGPMNQVLIHAQRPAATSIEPRSVWERAGRRILPAAAPIWILAPSRRGVGNPWPFIQVQVFDVGDTDGPPLELPRHLHGDSAALELVQAAARRLGITVRRERVLGTETASKVFGLASGQTVKILEGLSPLEETLTLAHEYAHVLLHSPRGIAVHAGSAYWRHVYPVGLREAEAHSTAYLVLRALNLPCEAPAYVVWQQGTGDHIRASACRIRAAAHAILVAINGDVPHVHIPRLKRAEKRAGSHRRQLKFGRLSSRLKRRVRRLIF